MCSFHSIVIQAQTGQIAHNESNSHTDIIRNIGWTENGQVGALRETPRFYEYEWNGLGQIPNFHYAHRYSNKEVPDSIARIATDHYTKLHKALKGDTKAQKYFDQPDYGDVREIIAKNPFTGIVTLRKFAKDINVTVRKATAANPSTPTATLETLAQDAEFAVRAAAIYNPNKNAKVLTNAFAFCDISSDSSDKFGRFSTHVYNIVNARLVTPKILAACALSENAGTRKSVALHKNTDEETLITLSNDSDSGVRESVASNPNMPLSALERLSHDRTTKVNGAAKSALIRRRNQ